MTAVDILVQILLAGLLGITGQLLRVIVGMKKLNDEAVKSNVKTQDLIVVSSMVISILLGFVTGIVAWLSVTDWTGNFFDSKGKVLGIIAAGYSGADFIEGFISKYLPQNNTDKTTPESKDSYTTDKPVIQAQTNTPPSQGEMPQ